MTKNHLPWGWGWPPGLSPDYPGVTASALDAAGCVWGVTGSPRGHGPQCGGSPILQPPAQYLQGVQEVLGGQAGQGVQRVPGGVGSDLDGAEPAPS